MFELEKFLPFVNLVVIVQISLAIGQNHFELYLEIVVSFLFVTDIFLKQTVSMQEKINLLLLMHLL